MTRVFAAVTLIALGAWLPRSPAAPTQTGTAAAHRFTEIAPGIYSAVGTPSSNAGSNSAVIVNRDDVVVVDSHMTPESGRALLRDIQTLTDKPVRFLVNTHFHYDHTDGNQAFASPVDIIGHEYTRARLSAPDYMKRGMLGN